MYKTTDRGRTGGKWLRFAASLFFIPFLVAVSVAEAATYPANEAGDWLNPLPETLAEAVAKVVAGDTITVTGNLTSSWDNWFSGSGYTIVKPATALNAGGTVTFDLGGFTLGGTALDLSSGQGTFVFQNGMLGTAGQNLGIGVNEGGSSTLQNVGLAADNLGVGSAGTSGVLTLNGGSSANVGSTTVAGYGSGLYLNGSSFSSGAVAVTDGAAMTLDNSSNASINGTLTVSGVGVSQSASGDYTYSRSQLNGTGVLNLNGNFMAVRDGAQVNLNSFVNLGPIGLIVDAGKTLEVGGVFSHAAGGQSFRSELYVNGIFQVNGGTTNIVDGGLLSHANLGISVTTSGILNVSGGVLDTDSGVSYRSTVSASGDMLIGGLGRVNVADGALIDGIRDIHVGYNGPGTLTVSGVNAAVQEYSTIQSTGNLTVGNSGRSTVNVATGGLVSSTGSTRAGALAGSAVNINVNAAASPGGRRTAWSAGGAAVTPDNYVAPKGNTSLVVGDGVLSVSGLFAMAGQSASYANGYGQAIFGGSGAAELSLQGGSFYNRNQGATIGQVLFNNGSIISGSGSVYAGDLFAIDGGTIAAGGRWMYDFDRSNNDKLTSLGTIDIYDNNSVTTQFHNTTFQTELDRGTRPDNWDGLSDRAIVHGDLDADPNFKVAISRPLNGKYLLVQS